MTLVMQGATGISGRCYTTLLVLAHHADEETGICWPGIKAISFLAHQSPRTTRRAIEILQERGWISIDRWAGKSHRNRYTLDFEALRVGSIRRTKPVLRPQKQAPRRAPQLVEKPVEKLLIPCGSAVEKPAGTPGDEANRGIRTIKESLENYRELQSKTGSAGAGLDLPVSRSLLPADPGAHRLQELLGHLIRSAEHGERGRARSPGLSPPPLPSWA